MGKDREQKEQPISIFLLHLLHPEEWTLSCIRPLMPKAGKEVRIYPPRSFSEDIEKEEEPDIGGGKHKYRGKHRSDTKGVGAKAFFRSTRLNRR